MANSGSFDEAAAIGNFWTDAIYTHDFRNETGKYFNIVTEEDGNRSVEYHPPFPSRNRIKLTVTFLKANGEIKEVTLKKFKQYTTQGSTRWEEVGWGPGDPMTFSHFTFEKLLGFLKLLTELDLANLNERRIALREQGTGRIDAETQAKMRSLLQQPDGLALVDELLRNGSITSRDLVNIGYRKAQLDVFEGLMNDPGRISAYGAANAIAGNQLEKIWQHFFMKNQWIFGFGLDYRFLSLLQREAHVGEEDLAGRGGSIGDFLLAAKNFTVLVEIKRPDTPLFEARKNRTGSWKLSTALVDSVSQILEQKAAWQIKAEVNSTNNYTTAGGLIEQKTIDPKCILIVGSDSQFSGTDNERAIKLRTFELFRRDSRNIEIVTFDELYERAKFIVGQGESGASAAANA